MQNQNKISKIWKLALASSISTSTSRGRWCLCAAVGKHQLEEQGVAVLLSTLRSLVASVLDEKFSAASKSLYLFLLPLHQLSFIVQP